MAELIDLAEARRRRTPQPLVVDDLRAGLHDLRTLWDEHGAEIIAAASDEEIAAAHLLLDEADRLGAEADAILDELDRRLGID